MNEDERADWLARAIEDLIRGAPPVEPPPGLDRSELDALTRVARARLEGGRLSAHEAQRYEKQVWQEVLSRLDRLHRQDKLAAIAKYDSPTTNAGDVAVTGDPEQPAERELQDIAVLRQQMADDISAFAEAHREDVWRQVRARISSRPRRKGLFPFLRRRRAEPRLPAVDADSMDQQADDLVDIAGTLRALSTLTQAASEHSKARVWSQVRTGLNRRALNAAVEPAPRRWAAGWPRLAGLAAGLALVIAAAGPLPATGFADHPLAGVVTFVGRHIGVTESGPPPVGTSSSTVTGADVDLTTAAALMGLPVRQPASLPDGFRPASSRYFPQPLTADRGGLFALSYEQPGSEATLMVYQEADSGVDLTAAAGSPTDITIAAGVPATYFEGAWRTTDGRFVWDSTGSQSLVFDHAGIRTIIQYRGSHIAEQALIAVADSMTAGGVPGNP